MPFQFWTVLTRLKDGVALVLEPKKVAYSKLIEGLNVLDDKLITLPAQGDEMVDFTGPIPRWLELFEKLVRLWS